MDAQLLLSIATGIAGIYVGHLLTRRREQRNRLQQHRIQYLVEAYRAFAKAAHHPRLHEIADELEQAIADVQLLGSPELIELIQRFCREMADNQTASLDDILEVLRRDLRSELGERPVSGRMVWFRIGRGTKDDHE